MSSAILDLLPPPPATMTATVLLTPLSRVLNLYIAYKKHVIMHPMAMETSERETRVQLLTAFVDAQALLTLDELIEFKHIAYGWTHIHKNDPGASFSWGPSPAAKSIALMDAQIQARRPRHGH
jgi:hypothetical protein